MKSLSIFICVLTILAAGCASPLNPVAARVTDPAAPAAPGAAAVAAGIPPGIREAPPDDPQLLQVRDNPKAYTGRPVRWGGAILSLGNESGWTRVEVQAHPLGQEGQPEISAPSPGRFIVRAMIPFDPEVYEQGRPITVAGTVQGADEARDGRRSPTPIVKADDLYLWDQSQQAGDRYAYALRPRTTYDRCPACYDGDYEAPLPGYYNYLIPGLSLGLSYSRGYGWGAYPYAYWPGRYCGRAWGYRSAITAEGRRSQRPPQQRQLINPENDNQSAGQPPPPDIPHHAGHGGGENAHRQQRR